MLEIFKNNVRNSLMALVLGVGLGIVPFMVATANGLVLGMLADFVSRQQGTLFVIAALLPHGIIELPMVLISVGIGLRLGHVMYMYLKGIRANITQELTQGVWFYVRWVVPLLLVAAFIESYVTPLIASQFIG
jgi:stage II sporulation protein M